jgi:hypothetical protein
MLPHNREVCPVNVRPKELVAAVWAVVFLQMLDAAYTVGLPLSQGTLAQGDVTEAIVGAILWLVVAYLIYMGRGWLRYVYTVVVFAGAGFLVYAKVTELALIAGAALSVVPCVLWFMPASNRWFSARKQSVS